MKKFERLHSRLDAGKGKKRVRELTYKDKDKNHLQINYETVGE